MIACAKIGGAAYSIGPCGEIYPESPLIYQLLRCTVAHLRQERLRELSLYLSLRRFCRLLVVAFLAFVLARDPLSKLKLVRRKRQNILINRVPRGQCGSNGQ